MTCLMTASGWVVCILQFIVEWAENVRMTRRRVDGCLIMVQFVEEVFPSSIVYGDMSRNCIKVNVNHKSINSSVKIFFIEYQTFYVIISNSSNRFYRCTTLCLQFMWQIIWKERLFGSTHEEPYFYQFWYAQSIFYNI